MFRLLTNYEVAESSVDFLTDPDIIEVFIYDTSQEKFLLLFGKGYHNIYQPLDSELKNVYNIASGKEFKKAVITMHSNRMFKDAGRFKIYKETGEFPKVTKSVGVDSLAEVLGEDAIFPSSKQELINHQGWKVIDLTPSKRVHARNLLQELPEKTYYGIQDITQALGDL